MMWESLEVLSLSEEFFCGEPFAIEVRARMLYGEGTGDVIGTSPASNSLTRARQDGSPEKGAGVTGEATPGIP